MNYRLHSTLVILLNTSGLLAQPVPVPGQGQVLPAKAVFYYTTNWELTTSEKSFFRREATVDLNEMVFDGIYKDYDRENKLIAEGFYAKGERRGLLNEYFSDRTLKYTIAFFNSDFSILEFKNVKKRGKVKQGKRTITLNY